MTECHQRGKWVGVKPFRSARAAGNLLRMSGTRSRDRATSHKTVPPPPAPPALPVGEGTTFARALWRIASADVSAGNSVTLFDNGAKTFDAMIAMIDESRHSVVLESYILRGDSVGQRFAVSLGEAAKRGVQVRVLGDWVGSWGTPRSFHKALRRSGVELRIFNQPGWRPWLGLVPRDHRKLLVADGAVGLTGGIGIGEQWQTGVLRRRKSPWRDTCVRIAGPAAVHLARAFEGMWRRAAGERPARYRRRLVRAAQGADVDPDVDAPSVVGIVEGEPGKLRIGRALHLQSAAAQRSIWLASAYFVPSFAETEALAGAARDGVDVRLLVPSKYDHPWIRRFATRFYRRLLRNGVRIWEWRGEMMHAKTTVVDGRWVRVGSTDFNPFGVVINFELDALIEDAAIGAEAEEMFLRDLTQSTEIRRRRGRGA